MQRSLLILGSTGSIGANVLNIVRAHPDRLRVAGLTAHSNARRLAKQAREFQPSAVALTNEMRISEFREQYPDFSGEIVSGESALTQLAHLPEADTVVVAVVGSAGYEPTLAAIKAGKRICLANKETLVVAGSLVMSAAKDAGVDILPIDSEHSAIFQCLQAGRDTEVSKLILTGSGGPFRTRALETFDSITRDEALAHPNWDMGAKITIDSATMMNKAFEIIEAVWLFDIPPERVQVVIHPQSIVHSAVEFADGSVIAQMGIPDMRLPIQYALLYPDRVPVPQPTFNLTDYPELTFLKPDSKRFPSLALVRDVIQQGGTYPAVFNAADEAAVGLFLAERIAFPDILRLIEGAIEAHKPRSAPALEDLGEAGRWAHEWVQQTVTKEANTTPHGP